MTKNSLRLKISDCLKPLQNKIHSGTVLLKIVEQMQEDMDLTPVDQASVCSIIMESIQ